MASFMYGQPHVSAPFQYATQRGPQGPGPVQNRPRPSTSTNGYGGIRKQQKHQKQQKFKSGGRANGLTAWQVLSELEHAIQQKQIYGQYNPFDVKAQNDHYVLCQLRAVVQAGVSASDLQAIHHQLRTLLSTSTAPQPPAWQRPPIAPAVPMAPPSSYPSVVSHPVPAPQSSSLENALLGLVRSGVIGTASQQGNPSSVKPELTGEAMDVDHTGKELSDQGKYTRKLMRQKVLLRDLQRTSVSPRDVLGQLFYDNLPVKCRQCAQRFQDSTEGKQAYQTHLDVHFRQNRQFQSSEGRGFSRSLFVDREDWVTSVDPKGKQRALHHEYETKLAEQRRIEELQKLHVIIPVGDETKPLTCPVCYDAFKTEFLEDEEEWVWTNAMKDGETLYHATCHAELHAKRRSGAAPLSRSHTPDVASRKRKAEDNVHDVRPSKRVSL
ncbi:hypothetical protein BD626DRAFT_487743 [Schizophyllum amplum]|uniref:Pcf11 C-terminal domain-containing protein n=1 Tax=Schizophyllum amplum TaxID=97359 RepID=A0A550CNR9_9AGAR|nr:hypothetical protein BD626DRAFT_487743 [Auriculariopsis ampla]